MATANNLDNRIYNTARNMGMPDYVAANIVKQARLESADYTSNVFKTDNNLFGYKYVGQKKWPTGPGLKSSEFNKDGSYYAHYSTPENSIGELVDWLKRRQAEGSFNIANLHTEQQYAQALKSVGYYGDTANNYTNNLVAKSKLVDWSKIGKIAGTAIVGFIILGALTWYGLKK